MTEFKNFVQNLSDADVANLIITELIRSLGDSDMDVEFDDDITDLGDSASCAVVHLTRGNEKFFTVLVLEDRGLVLQVHPHFVPKLTMVASRISGTKETYDDWQSAIEHTPEAIGLARALQDAASMCEAAPAAPDEFIVLRRISDKFFTHASLIANEMGVEITIDVNRINEYTGAMIPVLVEGMSADLHILDAVNQACVTLPGTDIILQRQVLITTDIQ